MVFRRISDALRGTCKRALETARRKYREARRNYGAYWWLIPLSYLAHQLSELIKWLRGD